MASNSNSSQAALLKRLQSLLCHLVPYLQNSWIDIDDNTGFFGDGSNGENGIRTNASLAFAASILLLNARECQLSEGQKETLAARLRALCVYLIDAHRINGGKCRNGKPWGLVWQSSWWTTKLALAVSRNASLFDDEALLRLRSVVLAEVDLLIQSPIPTGLHHDTKAEETAWDAEIIAFAISQYAEHPDVALWKESLVLRLVNTFSCPSDRRNDHLVDGAPIHSHVRSCNIHEDGVLENHGCVHFCYFASPLLSKAWCHYCLRQTGWIPESLTHNTGKVWEVAERWFLGNRFAYVGGQDWARYTYGEYFVLPALAFLSGHAMGSHNMQILERRLRLLELEAGRNLDGSFYGSRFTSGKYTGQHAKYEADTFACLALLHELVDELVTIPSLPEEPVKCHRLVSHESQTCYQRAENFFFSFSWRTLQSDAPNLSMIPLSDDSLAEWHSGNFLGEVRMSKDQRLVGIKSYQEDGQDLTVSGSHLVFGPGGQRLMQAHHKVQLLGGEGLAIIETTYKALSKAPVARVHGIKWRVPNDFFNDFQRSLSFGGGSTGVVAKTNLAMPDLISTRARESLGQRFRKRLGLEGTAQELGGARWLNVDGRIGLILLRGGELRLRRYGRRMSEWDSLYFDQVETDKSGPRFRVRPGDVLLDTRIIVHIGDAERTQNLYAKFQA